MNILKRVKFFSLSLICLFFMSCSGRTNNSPMPSIDPEAKKALQARINCNTAERDIKILEDEKASVGGQVLAGVRSVLPIAAVAGILMGDYSDRVEVATGQYNSDIEAKIEQIKRHCGVR